MIISHKYKYLFVEVPLTASTAISAELCEYYDGQPILGKHSHYSDFLRQASAAEKEYRVVAGIRNPLDQIVSRFHKLRNNHRNSYTEAKNFVENGGWVSKRDRRMFAFIDCGKYDFSQYFAKFFGSYFVRKSQYMWLPETYDKIIRFEYLQEDFSDLLKIIGAEKERDLPVVNKTDREDDFLSFYVPEIQYQVRYVFGPYMKYWGYRFSEDWQESSIPWHSEVQFNLVNRMGRFIVRDIGLTPGDYLRLRRIMAKYF